jgi:peptidoglycan hydrolase CwlO-like protein
MNTLSLILASSVTTAVIEIIALLLGAAIIGFLTAWYYQKAHFTPIIKKLEAEKEELNNTVNRLNNDISGLKSKIVALEKTISEKDKQIEELKNPKKPAN